MTLQTGTETEEPRSIAWCGWHNGLSDTTRLIQTSPNGQRFACQLCRQKYNLTPLADQTRPLPGRTPMKTCAKCQHGIHPDEDHRTYDKHSTSGTGLTVYIHITCPPSRHTRR